MTLQRERRGITQGRDKTKTPSEATEAQTPFLIGGRGGLEANCTLTSLAEPISRCAQLHYIRVPRFHFITAKKL